ncbi:MAG: flavodoxin [Bacteroidia bacterium]|nr:MAG: flavodoxin [Bacteroidia bacterium]
MKKIGLFYAPKGGSTEKVAKMIEQKLGSENVELIYVNQTKGSDLSKFDNLIIGSATVGNDAWDGKHPKSAWDKFWPNLASCNFSGKIVALFGLGNQVMYANNFVDSLGQFGTQIARNGGKLVGKVSGEGYDFNESEGFVDGMFLGLPLDEDTEDDKTEERLNNWLENIKNEFI